MKNKIILLIILLLGLVGLSFFRSVDLFNQNLDISKFQTTKNLNTNFTLETPAIKDKNLAKFYLWTMEDPLFTAPGFDTAKFSSILKTVKNENDIYVKKYNFQGNIFPIDFLNDLINVSKIHNDFINNPNADNAARLIASYKTAAKDYREDILDLRQSSEKLVPQNPEVDLNKVYLVKVNTTSSMQTFFNDLDKIKLNADALTEEIAKRENCLQKGIDCKRPVNEFNNFKVENKSISFNKKDILPKDILWGSFATMSAVSTWSGPFIVSTQCFGWSDNFGKKPYLFDVIRVKRQYPFFEKPISFTQFYAQFANDRIYKFPEDYERKIFVNLKRNPTIPSNDYMCPSADYRTKLNSIDYLFTNYKNKQIFSNLLKLNGISNEAKDYFILGQKLEKKFFEAEFPSEVDADNLVNAYGLLYKKILLWAQEDNDMNNNWLKQLFKQRFEVLNLYLGYKRGLVSFDELMASSMYYLHVFRLQDEVFDLREKTPDIYVYMSRSSWGLFYFPFSKSFYRYDKQPDYLLKIKVDNVGKEKRYINYKQAIENYSLDEIKSWYTTVIMTSDPKYKEYLYLHSLFNR
jgi:hypothetical protein